MLKAVSKPSVGVGEGVGVGVAVGVTLPMKLPPAALVSWYCQGLRPGDVPATAIFPAELTARLAASLVALPVLAVAPAWAPPLNVPVLETSMT